MALGFNRIVMGDRGELGPIDVQLASKEELYEYNSGLDMIQAMDWLQRHAKSAFHDFLKDIRVNTRLGTKSSGEMARQLTQGLFSGMYNQLDPVRLGHVQRTMRITQAYGYRLAQRSKCLQSNDTLEKLVYKYPSHDFVIDRKEANDELFCEGVVRAPDDNENIFGMLLYQAFRPDQNNNDFVPLGGHDQPDTSVTKEEAPITAATASQHHPSPAKALPKHRGNGKTPTVSE